MVAAQQQRSNWQQVHGVMLLDKPRGCTSQVALQQVRRALRAEKAGHTGTLDPLADGLLAVVLWRRDQVRPNASGSR
jgi:tRNA pseudouridine synthase B (EC 4.2.1.70)